MCVCVCVCVYVCVCNGSFVQKCGLSTDMPTPCVNIEDSCNRQKNPQRRTDRGRSISTFVLEIQYEKMSISREITRLLLSNLYEEPFLQNHTIFSDFYIQKRMISTVLYRVNSEARYF